MAWIEDSSAKGVAIEEQESTAESLFVTTNGLRLRVLRYPGVGPHLLLLPGITSPAATWGFVAERLAQFCRPTVVDMRGRGLSDQPDNGYQLADYVADTAGLIRALELQGCVVLGHSMGARVALVFAASHPDLLSKLISVDPPASGPGRRPYKSPLDQYLTDKRAVEREGPEAVRRQRPEWSEERVLARAKWLPTCGDAAITESYHSMHDESFYPSLPRIQCPTLLIYAAQGNTVSDEDAREIVAAIPKASAVRIERAGHMIPWDNLDEFVDAVRSFVAEEAR